MKRMPFMLKKITASLALLSFVAMAFFSFTSMTYGSDGRMQGDCPFSNMGTSLCPQSALPGAIHHLFAYQSFLNVPINSGITALILALLVIVSAVVVFSYHPILLYKSPVLVPYRSPSLFSPDRKIRRWLSLFELSPSF